MPVFPVIIPFPLKIRPRRSFPCCDFPAAAPDTEIFSTGHSLALSNRNALSPDQLLRALGYSLQGLKAAWNERAFKQELAVLVIAIPLGLWLGETPMERAMLIGSWMLVIIIELLNSAVEATVDRSGLEKDELAGRAKDMGAAAVLCAIILATLVWGILLLG